jgi:hypothetical protein
MGPNKHNEDIISIITTWEEIIQNQILDAITKEEKPSLTVSLYDQIQYLYSRIKTIIENKLDKTADSVPSKEIPFPQLKSYSQSMRTIEKQYAFFVDNCEILKEFIEAEETRLINSKSTTLSDGLCKALKEIEEIHIRQVDFQLTNKYTTKKEMKIYASYLNTQYGTCVLHAYKPENKKINDEEEAYDCCRMS